VSALRSHCGPCAECSHSADGRKLAYGSSDLSIGVLDARTLRVSKRAACHARVAADSAVSQPIVKILDAHSFPPTALRFSPSGNVLVSASADNTIRVIDVPHKYLVEQSWCELHCGETPAPR
jgi:prolactin regulatory element-binding protein